jgi:hypothetical protein
MSIVLESEHKANAGCTERVALDNSELEPPWWPSGVLI